MDNRYCTDHVLLDRDPTMVLGETDPPSIDNSYCTDPLLVDTDTTIDLKLLCSHLRAIVQTERNVNTTVPM